MSKSDLSTVASFGKHHIHRKFVENLLCASHERQASLAAAEWYTIKTTDEIDRCHLCNTRIQHGVVLRNNENGNVMVIGQICHEKLALLIVTNHVKSPRAFTGGRNKTLRRYTKNHLDETVLGWFEEESKAGRLPTVVSGILEIVKTFGFAPSKEAVDEMVRYYCQNRQFPIRVLIGRDLTRFPHPGLLPNTISINQGDQMLRIIERWDQRQMHQYQRRQFLSELDDLFNNPQFLVEDSARTVLQNIKV